MAKHTVTQSSAQAFLGLDCGATRSVAVYECGGVRRRVEAGPGNLRLLSDAQLLSLFQALSAAHDGQAAPAAVAIGMASARLDSDRQRIRAFAAKVWPGIACLACDDLQTALAAAELEAEAGQAGNYSALIITLAGTGSCFFGKNSGGQTVKVGGWGHILGDDGSAYAIGLAAMRQVVWHYDRNGQVPTLGTRLLRSVLLNKPEELSAWAVNATKSDIAAFAVEVAAAAAQRDVIARDILHRAAENIATEAVACAKRLVRRTQPVRFVFAGSVLLKNAAVARRAAALIKKQWPKASIAKLTAESAVGAAELARRHAATLEVTDRSVASNGSGQAVFAGAPAKGTKSASVPDLALLDVGLVSSPTESRNPLSMNLDKLPLGEAIALMLREDEKIPVAILAERKKIEQTIQWIVRAFKNDGRLFYVGAGTSGRLGVLDASECPPTFRSDPELVQGIIAGGQTALWRAAEGAEDSPAEGERSMQSRNVTARDVVVGIAASGRTPFVWGALNEARARGAKTVLLTLNPNLNIPNAIKPSLVIAPNIGPEILTGSTRLKSGTATKLILNILTTLAMVRIGKVLSNLMVDVKPTNVKLRDRAVRIVRTLTGVEEAAAKKALDEAGWIVKDAVARLKGKRLGTK